MSTPFHLTAHSAYSLLEGTATPAQLVQTAHAHGMHVLGLTDRWLLSGAVEFVQACREVGIQPLLGLEIDLPHGRLTLLAKNLHGWGNLCRISTLLAFRPSPQAACQLAEIAPHVSDLLALADGLSTPTALPLAQLQTLFGDALWLALSDPAWGVVTYQCARPLALGVVATHPLFFLTAQQAELQRTLSAIRRNTPLRDLPASASAPATACFLSPQELAQRFWNFPQALSAQQQIAAQCQWELPLGKLHLPQVPLPAGLSADACLRQKALAGVTRRYGELSDPMRLRLEHELASIAQAGFAPIFLIVEEVLRFARKTGVPYSSRGSAASSLVAHALGITSPDPLRLNLYFERFLNPARSHPPDIDTDLCSRRRDSVIQHVFELYGAEKVAMVATINHYRPRSALTDVAKAHGLSPATIRTLAEQLPGYWFASRAASGQTTPESLERARELGIHPDFLPLAHAFPQHQLIFSQASALLKLPRHLSVHPGGLVVAPQRLTDLLPLLPSGSKGITITQMDLEGVEALGLVKIDLLGIRGLTVLGDVAEFIQSHTTALPIQQPTLAQLPPGQLYPSEPIASSLAILEATPWQEATTAACVESGHTIGCFQIESPGMRAILREIHARSVDDIMAALALFRPGPLTGGLKDAFVRRFRGQEAVRHLHPALAPLLDETFGVILYQEQVLRLAHELAGLSLAEADLLRRAMSHFDPGQQMKTLQEKFVRQAQERSAIPTPVAERIWEMMSAFAGYGFPKAHAASYAEVAWRSAWCKTHFPAEFMAGVLANWGGYYSQRVYLSETRRLGLRVLPPDVQFSRPHFSAHHTPNQGTLYMGLSQVKGLTQRTIARILQMRPFHSIPDFVQRVDPRPQEAHHLAQVGAFNAFANIPGALYQLQNLGSGAQLSLFGWSEPLPQLPDWTLTQKLQTEQELLGIGVSAHPLELASARLQASGALDSQTASARIGQRVKVAGIRQTAQRGGLPRPLACLLELEDAHGMTMVALTADVYRLAKPHLGGLSPLLVVGIMRRDNETGEPLLWAESVERL